MIKQYDFPIIFQNVVGQVVPIRKKKIIKYDPSLGLVYALYQQVKNIDDIKVPGQANRKLQIQSKKKKIVRRFDFSKTSAWTDGKNPPQPSDKVTESEDKTTFSNFLKRKKNNVKLHKRQSMSSDRLNDSYFLPQKMGLLDIQSKEKGKIRRIGIRTNNMRIKTSSNQFQRMRNKSKDPNQGSPIQRSNKNVKLDHEKDEIKEDISNGVKKRRQKQKHKTYFKNESPQQSYSQQHEQIRRGQRKKTKKKTVNFNINNESENISQAHIRKNSSNTTKVMKNFRQKSFRMHYNKSQSQFGHGDNRSESQWTDKSVISIKLSQNARTRSKKSLRSQQSILLDSYDNFLNKKTTTYKRYGTKKVINMTNNIQFSLKKVKSMMCLQNTTTKQKPVKNVTKKKVTEVKLQKSEKVIKPTMKKTKNKISILVKSKDPYLLSQSTKSIDMIRSSNFQDLVFQKSRKNMMKTMRTQGNDVFSELNNFHRFLNENDIDDNQQQIPRVMTKPMVIDSSTDRKEVVDRKIFNNQCKMIDMGLNLIKNLSILRQKKI